MTSDQFCRLCLEESATCDNLIEILKNEENCIKMTAIINLHFSWLEMKLNNEYSRTMICMRCWNVLNEFHSLYIKVETAHEELKEKLLKNEIILNACLEESVIEPNDTGGDNSMDGFDSLPSVDDVKEMKIEMESVIPLKQLSVKMVRLPLPQVETTPNPIRQSKSKRIEDEEKISEFFDLRCAECAIAFPTFAKLKFHQKAVHNHKEGFVYCCNKKLNRRAKLVEHMNFHLNPELLRCKICQKLYSDKSCLRLHMAYHIPQQNVFECDTCSKKFVRKYQLTRHFMSVHLTKDRKDHKCTECNKSFSLNSNLQSHIRQVHLNLYRHICDICAKEFQTKDQYKRHQLQHLEAAPKIVCECGARLKNAATLQSHIRRYHQNTPQTCETCGKISPNLYALRNHIRYNHQITRQYECTVCQKSFKKSITLKEHMAGHLGITLYSCPYCPKTFNSTGSMYTHRKTSHFLEWQRDRTTRS